jgi:Zn-dependent protease with chaperone function
MSSIVFCAIAQMFVGEPAPLPKETSPQAWLEIDISESGQQDARLIIQASAHTPIRVGRLRGAFRAVVGPNARILTDFNPPDYRWSAASISLLAVEGGEGSGEIDLGPLFGALRQQGIPNVVVFVSFPETGASVVTLSGRPLRASPPWKHAGIIPTDTEPAIMTVWFDTRAAPGSAGRPGDPRWLWLLAAVPAGTAGLAWRVRRLAARPGIDAVTLGFRYMRFQSLLPLSTVVAWLGAIAVSGAAAHVGGWLGGPGTAARAVRWGLCGYLPPAAITLLALVVTAPVVRRLREKDWPLTNMVQRSAAAPLLTFAGVLLFWLGIAALVGEEQRIGAGLIGAALVVWIGSARRRQRTLQLTPIPLTHGELRDRVAGLAAIFRVKVPQVGLLPSDQSRLANAYAVIGRGVWLSDRLVSAFGRREVDAVVAHELAHHRQHIPAQQMLLIIVVAVFSGAIAIAIAVAGIILSHRGGGLRMPAWWPPVDSSTLAIAVSIVGAQLFATFASRRREFAADRGSARATRDAGSLITALTRLGRINGMPDSWGWWAGLFLTHPSTVRRVAALAWLGRLSPEQVEEALESATHDADPCPIPPDAVAGAMVFSPEFRRRVTTRIGLVSLAARLGLPVLAAVGATAIGPGWTATVVLIAGAVAPFAAILIAANRLGVAGADGLRRGVSAKFVTDGIDTAGAEFVDLAPASAPLNYDGFFQWDVGFLWLGHDRLTYVGEQTRFALTCEQITDIRLGPAADWLRIRRVVVDWYDAANGASGAFTIWPGAPRSVLEIRHDSAALAERLQLWRDGKRAASPPSAVTGLGPPAFGKVYGVSLRQCVRPAAVLSSLLIFELLAAGLCVLAGLPFAPTVAGGGWYVLAVVAATSAVLPLPYWLTPERSDA